MATSSARRRSGRKKTATTLTDIPDHLVAEIFLRLPAAEDLARASAACVSFRRLVTDRSFIRSFRRLHTPPLLGFLHHDGFYPALPPHPSTPAARAVASAADFSFSFLPSHCRWAAQDVCDGRVLLHRIYELGEELPPFSELVVCDPLHQRYILLPPVPRDLVPPVQHPVPRPLCKPFLAPLAPLAEEEAAAMEETSFRVIYMILHCEINLSALVFSSRTGQWRPAASKAWSDLFLGEIDLMSRMHPFFFRHHYAYGCFYWECKMKTLLALDTRRMEFSMVDLPPGEWSMLGLAISEAGDGRLGMFGFHVGTTSDLSYTIAQNEGEGPSQWQMEKTISLDSKCKYCIIDATERYLLLVRTEASSLENPLIEYFSMDIKTLKLQWVCAKQSTHILHRWTNIYTNFPPSLLSSPTV